METFQIVYNNFEIADLDFYRGEAYMAYFEHLDRQGGFYYEVGPSPSLPNVNKIFQLRLPKNSAGAMRPFTRSLQHFFREIGYEHWAFTHCPTGDLWTRGRCICDPARSFGML